MDCDREGTIFLTRGRSKDYERCGAMTEDYARALHQRLGQRIAELDAERGISAVPVDDIVLAEVEAGIRFELFAKGKPAGAGEVTRKAATKAKAWLNNHLPPDNVVKLKRAGAKALAYFAILFPVIGVG
jgi:hypothetical protein